MTFALILVVAAVLSLVCIFSIALSRSLQVTGEVRLARRIQPIDVEAFRNLVDSAEDDYLRRRLSPSQFRVVQRERLRAMATYVQVAGRNAAILVSMGQGATSAPDPHTAEAARQLVNDALLLRRNAAFALLKIYSAMAWPKSGLAATPVLRGYERLNGSATLLIIQEDAAVIWVDPPQFSSLLLSHE